MASSVLYAYSAFFLDRHRTGNKGACNNVVAYWLVHCTVYNLVLIIQVLVVTDLSVCLDVNCGEAGCIAVNGSAVCLCIDTEPWTPPDHRLRCNRTLRGVVVDPAAVPPDAPGMTKTPVTA